MSQIVEVKPEQTIKDIPALTAAAKDLGLTLEGRGEVRFYSGTRTADHVIRLPGRYDLGFVKQADGTYSYLADNELIGGCSGSDGYGRSGEGRKALGENCGKLLQRYRYRYMERELKTRGYRVTERGVSTKGDLTFEYERLGYGRA